jgi:hypothetical protein
MMALSMMQGKTLQLLLTPTILAYRPHLLSPPKRRPVVGTESSLYPANTVMAKIMASAAFVMLVAFPVFFVAGFVP